MTVLARVNYGRWIADCPDCAGAELVEPGKLFSCRSCGAEPRRVVFPDERGEIEELLLARPMAENRNWEPGETLADLRRENEEYLMEG